jgi:predicted 3-demethylubiquinone-9 3-methyltransferase (glyoxalase superfamily)
MKQIIPNIWFDTQSEEAAQFYVSVFNNGKILRTDRYTDAGKEQHGHNANEVMSVSFEIEGQRFVGINGGPIFDITPAISFFIQRETAEEVDSLWAKLSDGAEVMMALDAYPFSKRYGWLKDKYGVSWQLTVADQPITQSLIPSLLFTQDKCGKAEEAAKFYASVFPDSSVGMVARYGTGHAPNKEEDVMYGELTIMGQQFSIMDSALDHAFTFTEGVSLQVTCETQEEIDRYWNALSAVPESEQCGWLKDKYGVSWQIVPTMMDDMLKHGTPQQIERVTAAFMQMKKFDLAELERVYDQA